MDKYRIELVGKQGERKILVGGRMMEMHDVTERMKAHEEEARRESIYDVVAGAIMKMDLPEEEKRHRIERLMKTKNLTVNLLIAGQAGSGKSSTINAMFRTDVAEVGTGVDPETESMDCYHLDNLTIWDTPGFGDGEQEDAAYKEMIAQKLDEKDSDGNPLIDIVLVVMDASSKDLGTTYQLIKDVIMPHMKGRETQVLIGLNQADMAMKGKHWDTERNAPDAVLSDFLQKKAESVRRRIWSETDLYVQPVIYSAGYKEEGQEQCKPYNLSKLFYTVIRHIPSDKRVLVADSINDNQDNWEHDDHEEDYKEEIQKSFLESIGESIGEGTAGGAWIGEHLLGIPGKVIGYLLGGVIGAVSGFFTAVFGS